MARVTFPGFNGVQLAADQAGDPAGPPVLLFHGGGQTRHAWSASLETLGAAGWNAHTVDLRGHGDSQWAPDGDYRREAYARDVAAIAATFDRPPVLVGASLGGIASMLAIGLHPGRQVASALVLVDVAVKLERDGVQRILEFMMAKPEGFASLDEVADAVAAYNPHRPRPSNLDGLRKNVRQGEDGRWRWHWDPRAFVHSDLDNPVPEEAMLELDEAAAAVTVPTLLVRGLMSDLLSEEGAEHLLTVIRHAEVARVDGAGHMVAGDRNDLFNDAVLDFLDRLPV